MGDAIRFAGAYQWVVRSWLPQRSERWPLVSLIPFIHVGYAAYRVNRDGGYRYPIIADLIEGR